MALLDLVQDLPKLSDPILGRQTTPEGALGGIRNPSSLGRGTVGSANFGMPHSGLGGPQTAVFAPPAPQATGQGLSGALSGLSDQLGQSLSAMPFTNAGAQTPGDISRPSLNPLLAGNGVGRGKDPKWDVAAAIADAVDTRRSNGGPGTYTGAPLNANGNRLLEVASRQLGVPYVFGALDPAGGGSAGIDCSGLTRWAFGRLGIDLPHSAAAQSSMFPRVDRAQMKPGDLVFFSYGRLGSGVADHVGIYAGNGRMIAASSSNGEVVTQPIDWANFIYGGQTPFGGRSNGPNPRRRNRPEPRPAPRAAVRRRNQQR